MENGPCTAAVSAAIIMYSTKRALPLVHHPPGSGRWWWVIINSEVVQIIRFVLWTEKLRKILVVGGAIWWTIASWMDQPFIWCFLRSKVVNKLWPVFVFSKLLVFAIQMFIIIKLGSTFSFLRAAELARRISSFFKSKTSFGHFAIDTTWSSFKSAANSDWHLRMQNAAVKTYYYYFFPFEHSSHVPNNNRNGLIMCAHVRAE